MDIRHGAYVWFPLVDHVTVTTAVADASIHRSPLTNVHTCGAQPSTRMATGKPDAMAGRVSAVICPRATTGADQPSGRSLSRGRAVGLGERAFDSGGVAAGEGLAGALDTAGRAGRGSGVPVARGVTVDSVSRMTAEPLGEVDGALVNAGDSDGSVAAPAMELGVRVGIPASVTSLLSGTASSGRVGVGRGLLAGVRAVEGADTGVEVGNTGDVTKGAAVGIVGVVEGPGAAGARLRPAESTSPATGPAASNP